MADSSKVRARPASTSGRPAETVVPSAQADRIRERNKRKHAFFLFKLTAFIICMAGFTYYFWPWSNTNPPEFQHPHIRSLNSTDFEEYVIREDGQFKIIKFYANWCDHCKTLAPLWSDAALANADPKVEFLQVECSNNNKLCRKAAVQGFPHLKIFYQGRIGYSRIGALNETELGDFIREGILASQVGQQRAVATEAEQEKDAIEDKLAQEKVKQHNEL